MDKYLSGQTRAEYFIPVMVKIPGREIALAKKRGVEHILIDFVGEIKYDYGGTTVTNIHNHRDIKLSDETAAQLAKRLIECYSATPCCPASTPSRRWRGTMTRGGSGPFRPTPSFPTSTRRPNWFPSIPWYWPVSASRIRTPSPILPAERIRPGRMRRTR